MREKYRWLSGADLCEKKILLLATRKVLLLADDSLGLSLTSRPASQEERGPGKVARGPGKVATATPLTPLFEGEVCVDVSFINKAKFVTGHC